MSGKWQQTGRKAAERPRDPLKSEDKRTVILGRGCLLGLRSKVGWSQALLAQKSGLSKDTISRAENCKPVQLGMAEILALTFDVELAQLLLRTVANGRTRRSGAIGRLRRFADSNWPRYRLYGLLHAH